MIVVKSKVFGGIGKRFTAFTVDEDVRDCKYNAVKIDDVDYKLLLPSGKSNELFHIQGEHDLQGKSIEFIMM